MNENFEPLKPTRILKKMVVISAFIIIVIGVIYYRSLVSIPFTLGVFVSMALNILKLRMLERTVQKVINMDDQEAGKNVVRLQYLLRYLMTGVVLVAVGLIHSYTSEPPFYRDHNWFSVWGTIFPNAPASFKAAPFISIWGAIAGLFTLQLSVIIIRFMKLEKDGTNFIKYEDDEEENTDEAVAIDCDGSDSENNDENNVNS